MQSSFNDLLAHQRGLVSGLHSAMGALEKELAPETIQAAPRSWLQWPRLLRAALSWKNYQRTYDRLFRRGGGLFDTLLGEHLREAFARESARVAPPRAQPRTAAEPHQKPEEKRA
ncbi:MAG: hypothetical protein HC848_00055 [Limnobacter sp.]|nr:hypothetical protein [Limnobacter sp.]